TNNTNLVGIGTFGGAGTGGDYLAIVGIEFYAYTRDPGSPSYNAADTVISGAQFLNPINWMLIEDCKWSFFSGGLGYDLHLNASLGHNINIRRNVIVDNYSIAPAHGQGLYTDYVRDVLLEENLFDHNGWNASVTGAGANVFNHNIYIQ